MPQCVAVQGALKVYALTRSLANLAPKQGDGYCTVRAACVMGASFALQGISAAQLALLGGSQCQESPIFCLLELTKLKRQPSLILDASQ